MKKGKEIRVSDLKVGAVIEFDIESIEVKKHAPGFPVVYEHEIWGEGAPLMSYFLSTHATRTPFVIEKIKNGVLKLRSALTVCDIDGNLPEDPKELNFRTELTTTCLFNEKTGEPYEYKILAIYDNLNECIEAHEGKAEKTELKEFVDNGLAFSAITNEMLETYLKKNHDYGNAFSEMYDELGINYGYGKIREKVNRIKTLKDNDAMVENEPLEDALLDCANYCILTLMEYQKHKKDGKD